MTIRMIEGQDCPEETYDVAKGCPSCRSTYLESNLHRPHTTCFRCGVIFNAYTGVIVSTIDTYGLEDVRVSND